MDTIDIVILAVTGLIGLSFVDLKGLLGKLVDAPSEPPATLLMKFECLVSIVEACEICESHGHTELADKLEALFPEAAKCIRRGDE